MAPSRAAIALAATAVVLAAAALQVRASARRAERKHPPRGRFIKARGIRLHYLEGGRTDAPPVVLLHGNAVRAEDWIASGVFDLVAERHRVLAFDRPGYGYSERPRDRLWTAEAQAAVLAEAFARLGVERPVVVGHSWGALVAVALGLDHPKAVSGLVLASGYHFPTARADVAIFSPPAIPIIGDVVRYTVGPLLGRLIAPKMIKTMFAPASVPPSFTEAIPIPMMLRPSQIRASAEDAATMTPRAAAVAERYGELRRMPVSIVVGAEDKIVDVERQSARLHRALPHSDFHIVPGLGHMVHHGAPELVAAVVEAAAAAAERSIVGIPAPVPSKAATAALTELT
ncbi:alpha/beta hydrolase [Siccirubricoccus deserti]|uniref:Alpha/beta hydrolase n=1 Tax=Siccirubricoccus deserti TaxID=2013562 RepID=A0A9X0UGP1_9PROT|nr:alpha/beta hydrolase [Siccirubricoccus deserti]MBC4019168.1 alpha/beta hydrolase [Siccirubricoccus deserti]GGC71754.1 alpha/beta hydrolase [Siccirubricoccus deserti]